MKTQYLEYITKAKHGADMLSDDLREAHHHAANSNPFLAMVLFTCLEETCALQRKLREIETILTEP